MVYFSLLKSLIAAVDSMECAGFSVSENACLLAVRPARHRSSRKGPHHSCEEGFLLRVVSEFSKPAE